MFLLHLHIITVQILLLVPGKLSHCSTCSIPVHLLLWVFCSKVFFSYSNIIFPHHTLQIEHGVLFCNTIFPTFTKFDRKENFDKGKKKRQKNKLTTIIMLYWFWNHSCSSWCYTVCYIQSYWIVFNWALFSLPNIYHD